MRWRVAVLIVMAGMLSAGALLCIVQSSALYSAGERIFAQSQPSTAQQEAASRAFLASSTLQVLGTPLAIGALLAVVGVLMVLAIRWHRRESATESRP